MCSSTSGFYSWQLQIHHDCSSQLCLCLVIFNHALHIAFVKGIIYRNNLRLTVKAFSSKEDLCLLLPRLAYYQPKTTLHQIQGLTFPKIWRRSSWLGDLSRLSTSENTHDIPRKCIFVGERYVVLKSEDIILNQDCTTYYMCNPEPVI